MADDGWIEWKGGECPVGNSRAQVRLRSGGEFKVAQPPFLRWTHHDLPSDIIAYRIVEQ